MSRAAGGERAAGVPGRVLVLLAAAAFGTLGVFSKLFYDAGGDAYTLLFLRFAITGPVFLILALSLGERAPGRRVAIAGLGLGVFQLGAAFGLFEGFERAPIALVTLLYFAYPLVTAVGATLLLRERFGLRRAVILAVALAGIAMTIGIPESATWVGIALGLMAGLCVAALILSSRLLMTRSPLSPFLLCGLMFGSPAVALSLALPAREPDFSMRGEAWGWALCAVVVSAVIPLGLFYVGVQRTDASVVGLLSSAEPLVSVLLAYAVLEESLGPLRLAGGALIVVSVAALSLEGRARRPRPHSPEAG
jgi:drug/metabolite transporter (DMT)-like permease